MRNQKRWLLRHECTSRQVIPQSPPPKDKKGRKWVARQQPKSLQNHPQPRITEKTYLHRPPEKRKAKFHGSKHRGNNTCCSDKGVVLEGGGVYTGPRPVHPFHPRRDLAVYPQTACRRAIPTSPIVSFPASISLDSTMANTALLQTSQEAIQHAMGQTDGRRQHSKPS